MNARDQYVQDISGNLRFLASWLPGSTIPLGTYGSFDGTSVTRDGDVSAFGLTLTSIRDPSATDIQYHSSGAVEVAADAGASIPEIGTDVSVTVTFARAGACLLHVHDAVEHRVTKLSALKEAILEMSRRAEWPDDRAVVVSIVEAPRVTALVSSKKGAQVSLRAKPGPLANLADPALGISVQNEHAMACAIHVKGHSTPLYQALVLRRGLLKTSFANALRSRDTIEPQDPLAAAIDDDFTLLQPM